jgi:hypothetical protein
MSEMQKNFDRKYECPKCGYISERAIYLPFEHKEHRFCLKCFLEMMQKTGTEVNELPQAE